MAHYNDLRRKFLDFLSEQLSSTAFEGNEDVFYRNRVIGKQMLSVSFLRDEAEINIVADVDIRCEELETIFSNLENLQANNLSATIGAELGKLSNNKTILWTVRSDEDIPSIGKKMLSKFWEVGWPFLEKYSSLEKILGVLIDDGQVGQLLCSIPHIRAKKALVAVYLLHGLGNYEYDKAVDVKTEYLLSINSPYLEEFLKFAFRLKQQQY